MNIPVIAGTVFAAFSLWMLRHSFLNLRKADLSTRWPGVMGRMTKVELWGNRNIDGEAKPVERISVAYEYTVNESIYSGSAIAFYTLVYPETLAFAQKHPENSEITVYHDPSDPAQSVLLPGSKSGNKRYSEIILASLALLVSIAVIVAGALGMIG